MILPENFKVFIPLALPKADTTPPTGIGLAFARLSLDRGAKGVIVGDLKLTKEAEELVSSTEKGRVTFVRCDVTRWSDLRNLIVKSVEVYNDVPDVYVPSAGVFEPSWSNFWDDEGEDDAVETTGYKTMRINVDHPIKLTRIALRSLLSGNKKGVVCLLSSQAGLTGIYLTALYCASKHALIGFAKSMALADHDEGVKIVCVCPGAAVTPLWTVRDDTIMQDFHVDQPTTPTLTPEDVAELMGRMVSERKYEGGAVVAIVKTPQGIDEKTVFEGGEGDAQARRYVEAGRAKAVLEKERGKTRAGH